MDRKAILETLKTNYGSVAAFANEVGIKREIAYQAVAGRGSVRARLRIAKALGKVPSELWPSRSDALQAREDALFLIGQQGEQ